MSSLSPSWNGLAVFSGLLPTNNQMAATIPPAPSVAMTESSRAVPELSMIRYDPWKNVWAKIRANKTITGGTNSKPLTEVTSIPIRRRPFV
jgi:hypothetical protein